MLAARARIALTRSDARTMPWPLKRSDRASRCRACASPYADAVTAHDGRSGRESSGAGHVGPSQLRELTQRGASLHEQRVALREALHQRGVSEYASALVMRHARDGIALTGARDERRTRLGRPGRLPQGVSWPIVPSGGWALAFSPSWRYRSCHTSSRSPRTARCSSTTKPRPGATTTIRWMRPASFMSPKASSWPPCPCPTTSRARSSTSR